jgi:uncharacterized coiled-coil DUF342 family protein
LTAEKDASKVKKLKEDLIALNENRKKLNTFTDLTKIKLETLDNDSRSKAKEYSSVDNSIKNIKNDLKLFENLTCPTCTAPLTSDFHLDIKKEKEESLITLNESYEIAKTEYDESVNKLNDLRTKGRQIHVKAGQLETQMENIKSKLIELADKDESDSSSDLKQLVSDFTTRKKDKTDGKLKK